MSAASSTGIHGPLSLSGMPLTGDDLAALYPWPDTTRWVRAMMVTTLDGAAAGPDALSRSVSSPADKTVFNTVRRHADAVLVGAGTLRAELYTPMLAKPVDQLAREAAGLAPAPVITVVSGSLKLPWHLPVWTESAIQPLVITHQHADPDLLAEASQHADVVTLAELTPTSILNALTSRGLRRIVCEGGPRLLRDLISANLVDEADITLSPVFAGTQTSPATPTLPQVTAFRLTQVLHADGTLMMRYLAQQR